MASFKDWTPEMVDAHNDKIAAGKKAKSVVTDQQVIDAYAETQSVWKAGEKIGLCGQSVHERLIKLGVARVNNQPMTPESKEAIHKLYTEGIVRGDGKLDALAEQIGHPKTSICTYARSVGLTDQSRGFTDEMAQAMGERTKKRIAEHGHPRGTLGMKHTPETLKILSEKSQAFADRVTPKQRREITLKLLKTKWAKYGCVGTKHAHGSWKSAWRIIGGKHKFFRSRWEANYARYLELLKTGGFITDWEHEPQIFWFDGIRKGTTNYVPDFKVLNTDGSHEWHEVKGWMDAASKTKIKRMKKYHPGEKLIIRDTVWFKTNKHLSKIVQGWETS